MLEAKPHIHSNKVDSRPLLTLDMSALEGEDTVNQLYTAIGVYHNATIGIWIWLGLQRFILLSLFGLKHKVGMA